MKYLLTLLIWCFVSMICLILTAILGTYNPMYMIHFFVGIFLIIIFSIPDAIRRDRKYRKYSKEIKYPYHPSIKCNCVSCSNATFIQGM